MLIYAAYICSLEDDLSLWIVIMIGHDIKFLLRHASPVGSTINQGYISTMNDVFPMVAKLLRACNNQMVCSRNAEIRHQATGLNGSQAWSHTDYMHNRNQLPNGQTD